RREGNSAVRTGRVPNVVSPLRHHPSYLRDVRPQLVRRQIKATTVPDPGYVFINASGTNAHRVHRAGNPLLTRSIFQTIARRTQTMLCDTPVAPALLERARRQAGPRAPSTSLQRLGRF